MQRSWFHSSRILASAALALATIPGAMNAAYSDGQIKNELQQTLTTGFPAWDRNHDLALDGREINALIENPLVRGNSAAAVVLIRNKLLLGGEDMQDQKVPREIVLALAFDRSARAEFAWTRDRILSGSRALFLQSDPNLLTFQQGRMGDCYLLSAIAAFVNRDPRPVRTMIKPKTGNTFEVDFSSGRKIAVSPVTDSELVLGVKPDSNQGTWLVVLEKAYASIRQERRWGAPGTNATVLMDSLDHGGSAAPVIEQLSGHQATFEPVPADGGAPALDRLHKRFIELINRRQLCIAGTQRDASKPLPKGIIPQHAVAILGYDSKRRAVQLFNPWGNNLVPAGVPGRVNGYFTRNGQFEMPLADFPGVFVGLTSETDRPLPH